MKHEEHSAENATHLAPFQYVLCAATSPAAKLQEEALTYLNQGINCFLWLVNLKWFILVESDFYLLNYEVKWGCNQLIARVALN